MAEASNRRSLTEQPAEGSQLGRKTSTKNRSSADGKAEEELKKRMATVNSLIASVEDKIKTDKATLGDFIRLLQLQKELEAEVPRDIQVSWVEPDD
jgi:hypothetical protein